jgi:hypothetical protein
MEIRTHWERKAYHEGANVFNSIFVGCALAGVPRSIREPPASFCPAFPKLPSSGHPRTDGVEKLIGHADTPESPEGMYKIAGGKAPGKRAIDSADPERVDSVLESLRLRASGVGAMRSPQGREWDVTNSEGVAPRY